MECESEVEGWRSVPVLADHVESMYVAESGEYRVAWRTNGARSAHDDQKIGNF